MASQRTLYNHRANTADDQGFCKTTLVHARGAHCLVGDLTAPLWRLHCALIRTPSHGICFEHAQNVHCRSAFYAIPQRLLAMPLLCCVICNLTAHTKAFCIFRGRCGIVVIRCSGVTGVLRKLCRFSLQTKPSDQDLHYFPCSFIIHCNN